MQVLAGHRIRAGLIAGVLASLLLALPGAGAEAQDRDELRPDRGRADGDAMQPPADPGTSAAAVPFAVVTDRDVDDRLPQPEDRYALAGGCYAIEVPEEGFVTRDGAGLTVGIETSAVPFHLQATRLGSYLLATDEGPDTSHPDAWWDVRGYVSAVSA
ncbi:MAG: hypothetical protein WEB03_06575, partial [Nitriliruptor sp.]